MSLKPVFRIWIRTDPNHLTGSVSDDMDPDPGSAEKKNSKKSIFCYFSDFIVNIVYMKKHCKTFKRANKIHKS